MAHITKENYIKKEAEKKTVTGKKKIVKVDQNENKPECIKMTCNCGDHDQGTPYGQQE